MVKSDNTVVSHFMTQPKLNGRQARWKELLAEFHFNLEYRSGKTNHVADALSRRADVASVRRSAKDSSGGMLRYFVVRPSSFLKPFREDMEDPSRSQLTIPSIRDPNSTGKRLAEAILDDRYGAEDVATQVEENVMGGFTSMLHDPLDAPHGVLASLPMPSAMDGFVVLAAPSDKRAYASVAPPIILASAQPQADANIAARADLDAKDKVADNGHVSTS
ncbi:PREDICTED: uncharacterized protein LOC109221369 [Nicotiana attenuata]|uniref:uncharacterized protein LOC109221369 n=1 Tax=Nicotiana attenuata TaxID=49451 RepID=UPI00090461FB|nr:PREDICTED: uncharacterized protein LOC109221369 [Nicotiana attenuata]